MSSIPISITLPQEFLEQIRSEVNKGSYASVSEFVRDAVRAMFEAKGAQFNSSSPGGFPTPIASLTQSNRADDKPMASWAQSNPKDKSAPCSHQTMSQSGNPFHSSTHEKTPSVAQMVGQSRSKSPDSGPISSATPSIQQVDSPTSKSTPPPVVIYNLGENYWITGKVERGQQLGGKLGFPTLNLDPSLLPADVPHGVFVAEVEVADRLYQAAGHYGPRKTLNEWRPTLEFHLLDFNQHVPGHLVRFRLLKQIRQTLKFHSLDQLKTQLADDVMAVRQFFGEKMIVRDCPDQ